MVQFHSAAPFFHMNSYKVDPDAYLERAKARFEEDKFESLFYAAFELRCFVEQRQAQYVEAQEEYLRTIPRAWKLSESFKRLQSTYDREQIQALTWEVDGSPSFQMYFVPVTKRILDMTVRLDNLRHAQKQYHPANDQWWTETKHRIADLYTQCWLCAQGNMLAPALVDKDKFIGEVAVRIAYRDQDTQTGIPNAGMTGRLRVEYLESPPETWNCDLEI